MTSAAMDFDSMYRREYPAMVALARAVCGDASVAEDIAQEAFTQAHRKWRRVAAYDRPGAWLRRVTINLAISRRRKVAREVKVLRKRALERPPAPEADHDQELWDAVLRLAPRQRAAIALFYQEDRTTREIADILGCSVSAATSHLHTGRRRLAVELAPEHNGEGQS